MTSQPRLLVIILTKNEEVNIQGAIRSVAGLAHHTLVFDSFSTDDTVAIATANGATVLQHPFLNYSTQRDAALRAADRFEPDWIFFLDADERISDELAREIKRVMQDPGPHAGFLVGIRLYWRGTWIRRGAPASYLLRLVRRGKAKYDSRVVNEYMEVDGSVERLAGHLIHEDLKQFDRWRERHIRYAKMEADSFFDETGARKRSLDSGDANLRMRIQRQQLYNRMPLRIRPFLLFGYTLFVGGGILDGPNAWHYHYWQKLWYRLQIDKFIIERRRQLTRDA